MGEVYEPDPSVEERERLERREDLADAFGFILSVPFHGQDEHGIWKYGLRPEYGWANKEIEAQFEREMLDLVEGHATVLISRGVLTIDDVRSIRSHPYAVGPAAQGWPQIFFDLLQDARPYLSDGAALLAWGYFFRDVISALWTWASNKEREASEGPMPTSTVYSGTTVYPGITLTRPAIVALCYLDLIEHYGIDGKVTLETFPRSNFSYATQDHPAGPESYLVRARVGRRTYFYHVLGTGKVLEHFLITGSSLNLLTLRDFTDGQDTQSYREPGPSQEIAIGNRKATKLRLPFQKR